ncbi:MAG: lysoplasmalogenase [Proteobacteria bacterium]|nr:lysoplasmalogenase [Pseudomonadota bacterium]
MLILAGPPAALLAAGTAFAVTYGLFFFRRPPSAAKVLVKTAAVACLTIAASLAWTPHLLTFALALCALGDAFLAGDPKRWLPPGLASFLAGHIVYVALFATTIAAEGFQRPDAAHVAAMVAVGLVGAGMLAWLWRSLGGLKAAVAAYVAAIVAMVATSLMLPASLALAALGALAFFASDGILSAQLFKQRFTGLAGQWAVWGLYFAGQALIFYAFWHATLIGIVI